MTRWCVESSHCDVLHVLLGRNFVSDLTTLKTENLKT